MHARSLRSAFALLLLTLVAVALPALAAADEAAPATPTIDSSWLEQLPPLIDREILFGDPEISGAQISPNGRFVTFRRPYKGQANIWIKGVDEPFDKARPITADTARPVRGYFWSRDSRYVLYVQDKGGNENYHIYALDPAGKAGPDGVPSARDLTPIENVRAMILSLPKKAPGKIIVGLNDRDPSYHDIYTLDIATGDRKLMVKNTFGAAVFLTDLDGQVRLGWKMNQDGGGEIFLVGPKGAGKTIYSCSFEETCTPMRFHKDGRHFYLRSNVGQDVDLQRLMLFDLDTGKSELVEADPEGEVDLGGAIFSDVSDELVATYYVGDRTRIYPRTEAFARDLKLLEQQLPDGEIGVGSMTADENLWIVSVSRDVNPGSVYLYDRKQGKVTKLYDSRPELPSDHLASMRPVRYPARDGSKIPAYLTVPKGVEGRRLPAVILPHGGPWARDTWGYDGIAQFLANRGYVVLQPNFRGSTGYGKAHLNGGNNGWGTGVMQHDLSDGVKYLIDSGLADPERVAIMGGSYGGYATLAGLAFTPELYAAGVDIVGPSNIITLFNSIPPYWKPIRKMFLMRVGDPDDPGDRKRLIEQSPFFHAKQIKAPLLVIQGANDPRVKKAEADQIVVALRDLDRQVEYLVAPDEGHGFAGEENRLAMFASIEEFLARHLGGRYQKEMPPAIAQRLDELRVDPATVTMPQADSRAEKARTAPLPQLVAAQIAPLEQTFTTTLMLPGDREVKLDSQRTITRGEDGKTWKLQSQVLGPMAKGADTYILDGRTLLPISRSAQQGPVSLELSFSPEKIHGEIQTPGGPIPVDLALEAPVYGDDIALATVFAALPLAEGYQTTLRTLDVQRQRIRLWSVSVEGRQSRTTPAGTFDTFRLHLADLDGEGGGGTFWIASDPKMVVAFDISVPTPMGQIKGQGELRSFKLP
ncbi:MAG TPA: S9 family peptidase [Acidobacteria bacterium]|nr:S9 family peptidase [Acidobacteriota bacterium]